jgi:HPt (histidine-containing phosphotransfer) domain-containing protein
MGETRGRGRVGSGGEMALDLRFIEKIRENGGSALVAEIVQLYLSDQQIILKQIQKAFEDRDPPRLQDRAHALRGCSVGLGAFRIGTLCREIEELSAAGDMLRVAQLVRQLEVESLTVRCELGLELSK